MGLNAGSSKRVLSTRSVLKLCTDSCGGTCHYNHDFGSMLPNGINMSKKSFNADSPAFTPKTNNARLVKPSAFSPKSIAAAAFTPRGSGSNTPAMISHSKERSAEFVPHAAVQPAHQFQEFVPGQTFVSSHQNEPQPPLVPQNEPYNDSYHPAHAVMPAHEPQTTHMNPYAQQATVGSQAFYQDASNYKYPLNYHLYTSIGPRRENLLPYQRTTADFFMPDDFREDLQRKSEATLQVFANSTLPQAVEHYHSLVALDTNHQKGTTTFGLPSWLYKAVSARDGHTYALRRIEGFRVSDSAAISGTINTWRRINSAGVIRIHEAFTGRWFGDSSLVIVTDYHACSQTLAEKYQTTKWHSNRTVAGQSSVVPESELWTYIVQLAGALKTIHEAGIASQTILPSKVLLTSKNRVRLGGCGVLDILTYDQHRPMQNLQRDDLQSLGRLVLDLAARNPTAHQNIHKALEMVSRSYSDRLRACLAWLVTPPAHKTESEQRESAAQYNVHALLNNIADKVVAQLDCTLQYGDEITTSYMRELENGRLMRLLSKLNVILERPDTGSTPVATTNAALLNQPSAAWSETGERYYLKLFRDYVFHQVDHDGRPVLDLGHIVTCLNKLDAGIDERIQLISRDEQSLFVVSFKEVRRGFEAAWADISKASNPARR